MRSTLVPRHGASLNGLRRALYAIGVAVAVAVAVLGGNGWTIVHDGYGTAGVEVDETGAQVRFVAPASADHAGRTHAALQATRRVYGDLDLTARMRTVRQLRRGSTPNPWETGWLAWHYRDDAHFYYVVLKPNGWELGKRDPAYPGGQRFLASGATPSLELGAWQQVRVRHTGDRIAVWVDGALLTTFTDTESPYLDGRVALYSEDAHAQFTDIAITPVGDAR